MHEKRSLENTRKIIESGEYSRFTCSRVSQITICDIAMLHIYDVYAITSL